MTGIADVQPALAGTTGEAWRARPAIATAIGVVVLAGPVALSMAAAYGASRLVLPPTGSRALTVGWWVALSGVATVSLVAAGRLARKLLPLAGLMRLSLVFPDGAPSRFRIALRTGTVDTLEQRLAATRRGSADRTPVESARILLELVAHLDEHDPLTRGHSERVRAYAQSIGRELGLDRRELDLLNWAALLHDVGKLEVPHAILAKAGRPTEPEWEILRGHAEAGAALASPLRGWLGEWSAAIEQHHERWDGKGYPHGLAGEEISLAGRIVAVADVFDVITSTRTYTRQASVAEARRELSRCAGTQFDPEVVRAFLAISVRQRRLAAPLAWLAQAAVLARLPVAQTAGALSVGAVATVAVGTGLGFQTHPPRLADAPAPIVRAVSHAAPRPAAVSPATHAPTVSASKQKQASEPRPSLRARPAPTPKPASSHRPGAKPLRPAPATPADVSSTPPTAAHPVAAPPEPSTKKPKTKPKPPAPEPKPSAPPGALTIPRLPAPPVLPPIPPALPDVIPELPPVPPPLTGTLADDLGDDLTDVTDDVGSVVEDVGSVLDPGTPLEDDLSDTLDDVSDTVDDLGALLTPPEQEPDDDEGGGGLLGPLLGG